MIQLNVFFYYIFTFNFKPSTSRPFGDVVRKDVRFPNEVDSDQCCACPNGFPRTSKLLGK